MTLAERLAAKKAAVGGKAIMPLLMEQPKISFFEALSTPPQFRPSEQLLIEVLQTWVADEMTSEKMPAFHNVHPRNWVLSLLPNLAERLKKAGY